MKKNGFTLLELLIGISLISIVMVFLFKLLNDIQNEGLSNTYIVSNQTNRDEIIKIVNSAISENGSLCHLDTAKATGRTTLTFRFCNNKTLSVTIQKREVSIEYESQKYNYEMSDSKAYYDINPRMRKVSYNGKNFLIVDIGTEKKGLKKTVIDDLEFIVTGNYTTSQSTENSTSYEYQGASIPFVASTAGTYRLEVWGAAGAYYNESRRGGYGGYSVAEITLNAGDTLYVTVGEQSAPQTGNAAFNGGGRSGSRDGAGAGGGATHIATKTGVLTSFENDQESVLIVAGGGGGYATYNCSTSIGGNGGGFTGSPIERGGTQTSGGPSTGQNPGVFGAGAYNNNTGQSTPGAGGGWYGGGTVANGCVAGGGSGYIGNSRLTNKAMYCYECTVSEDVDTKTISTTCANEEPMENCAKKGSGYARITKLS